MTNTERLNNAPGSGLNAYAFNSKVKSWADREEEFSSILKEKNTFPEHDRASFFVVKRKD